MITRSTARTKRNRRLRSCGIFHVRRSPRLAQPFTFYREIHYRGQIFLAPAYNTRIHLHVLDDDA